METKICNKCGEEKLVEEFGKYFDNRPKKYYYNSKCKICLSKYTKKYCKDNKEKISRRQKQYREDHKKESVVYGKKYREDNKEEFRNYMKKYYRGHRKNLKEYSNQYYKDNEEYIKKYRELNKERIRNYMEWYHKYHYQNNKDYYKAAGARRRAKKLNQTPSNINKEKINYMYHIANKMTKECGIEYHVDHIKPLSKGGLHHENNLQILRKGLNLKKADKWPLTEEEMLLYAGVTIKDLKKAGGNR